MSIQRTPFALRGAAAMVAAALLSALLAGCSGSATRPSTGEFIDDRIITTRVKAQLLQDESVSGMAIDVDTLKGTVQLSGLVSSEAEKRRAGEIARQVQGVKNVNNYLEVRRE